MDPGAHAMTRDEGIALIKQKLGFRQGTGLDASIVANMVAVQADLEAGPVKPFFLISEDAYTTTTPNDERLFIPDDFLEEVEDAVFKYVPDGVTEASGEIDLYKDEYDTLRSNFKNVPKGPPQAYCLLGNYFRLFPTPDAIYTVHLIYYQRDAALTSNIENKWMKWNPKIIYGIAGKNIAESLRDFAAVNAMQQWEAEGRILLSRQSITREMANRNMQIGGPH
jgi:hypothetical protein